MAIIRKSDYKDYVLFQKTVDDLYPTLPPASGSQGVGIFRQLRTLSDANTDWIRSFESADLDTSFCLKYGDRWLNPIGAQGLNFNSTTKVFTTPTYTNANDIATRLWYEYNPKWQKLYELMEEDYKPLDNWSGTEEHDGDWTKNGTKDTDNTTTFNGGDTRTDTYNLSTTDNNTRTLGNTATTTYNIATSDNNTRTLGDTATTTYNISTTDDNTRTFANTDATTYNSTVTDLQVESGGSVDETLVSGFNSGVTGTHPATVTTSGTGGQTVAGTDYVPKQLEKITTSDGKKTNAKTGNDSVGHTGTVDDDGSGSKTGTEAVANTGTIADVGTGGKTGTEAVGNTGTIADEGTGGTTGTMTRGTVFNNRSNVFDGTQTYDLDGTDDKTITYSGFMDRTGRGTRQALGEQEWEFRKHLFLDMVFNDISDFITLKIY